ncbi:amidohydrolase family-domain-containing protein [Fusarium oxysporum Fo47]|uniref:amidohydrolase family-domain-containing protein n=1 Tax=Fusarium oxysporum Fo47 TaxID=660027 RepID=UPI002869A2DE|nr:amidohydrolase family-domain-containing protein [Fusarium oxysporum Fo47]QKD63092.2 amidohydrolase family-domain-containing protein [Fusarium oxysporum Fo47]
MEPLSSATWANSVAYYNGRVYTVNEMQEWTEGFIVNETGVFEAVGSSQDILAIADKRKLVRFDLRQKFIMPGIHDAHAHMYFAGLAQMSEATLELEPNDAKIAEKIQKGHCMCSHTGERRDWILGNSYLPIHFPDNVPDRRYLDEIFPDRPVLIRELSVHSMLLNTTALERLNINDGTPDPPGGRYVRRADGTLSGELYESAMEKVWNAVPFPPMSHYKRALSHAVSICHSYGITSAQEATASTMELHAFRELEAENRLDFDIYTHIVSAPGSAVGESEDSLAAQISIAEGFRTKHIHPHFVKFILDGLYDAKGYTCKVHAAGEGSARLALDILEQVRALNPNGPRHEVAHCNSVHADDVKRFAPLRVTAEMSPAIFHNEDMIKANPKFFNWDFVGMHKTGALTTIGSDWVVVPTPNVLPSVACLAEPIGAGIKTDVDDGLTDLQRGSRVIIRMLTLGGAEAVDSKRSAGSIEVGKKANFIALDSDLSEGEFANATCLQTWFEGRRCIAELRLFVQRTVRLDLNNGSDKDKGINIFYFPFSSPRTL